ncbi:hypothetical protein GCM10010231_48950 [Streptomyces sindenensis]|nr:hypothetical protein GCM10010231_48950 [Streptomyces sindenensis]
MNTATRGHAAPGREDMGVPEDMPEQAGGGERGTAKGQGGTAAGQGGAAQGREGVRQEGVLREGMGVLREIWRYARRSRLSSDNVPEGARGAICIKRFRLPESRPDVI